MLRTVFKRSGIHFIGKTIGVLFSSLVLILLSRYLSPSEYGKGMLGLTIILFGSILADFGFTQWYQKQKNEKAAFSTIFKLRLLLSAIVSIILIIINNFLHWLSFIVILIIGAVLMIHSLVSTASAYRIRVGQVLKPSLLHIFQAIPILILFISGKQAVSVVRVFFCYLIGDVIAFFFIFPFSRLKDLFVKTPSLSSSFRSSAKYALLNYTSVTYARADSFIVRALAGSAALGFYGLAYRYLEVFALFPSSLVTILFPIFAQSRNTSATQLFRITLFMTLLGICFGTILFYFSSFIIIAFHGSTYAPTIQIIQMLSCALVFFFVNAPLATFVQSSHIVKQFLPLGVANTLLNIFLNIIFVLRFGVIGAAIVMTLTEITGLIINVWFVRQVFMQKC